MTGGRALQFRPNVLDAPGALDVAIVEFLMLWPEDEARRSKAMEAAVIRHLTELRGLPIPRSAVEVSDMVRTVSAAPRLTDFTADAKDAFKRGAIAGKIFFEAVGIEHCSSGGANLSRTKKEIAERFSKTLKIRMSEKTINNSVWPTYRSVSPFWAAWLYNWDTTGGFPCNPSDLGMFLATADAFRRRGETTRTPQSPKAAICGKASPSRSRPRFPCQRSALNSKSGTAPRRQNLSRKEKLFPRHSGKDSGCSAMAQRRIS